MSIRAAAIRTTSRLTIKNYLVRTLAKRRSVVGNGEMIAPMRRFIDRWAERYMGQPPAHVHVRSVHAGTVPGEWLWTGTPDKSRVLLYLHGGGYIACSIETHRNLIWRMARTINGRALAVNYRLAPEHPFPAAVDDAEETYRWLLDQGIDPAKIVVAGDSAGGGLTFALMVRLQDQGLPLPAACIGLSPWTDLAVTGPSLKKNALKDPMFDPALLPRAVDMYAQGADPYHPEVSPLYADDHHVNFPPTLVQVGSTEILLDDSRRLVHKLKEAGVECELDVWRNMPHVWQVFAPTMPEGREAVLRMGHFMNRHLPAEGAESQLKIAAE